MRDSMSDGLGMSNTEAAFIRSADERDPSTALGMTALAVWVISSVAERSKVA